MNSKPNGSAPDPASEATIVKPASSAGSGEHPPSAATTAVQFIGGYALVRKLGEGGMGAVYLAEDTKLGRKAAIKTMRPELAADAGHRTRFEREARAAAAVEHENIVPIWGIGEAADGSPFIAMPFLQGESLGDRIRRQPVSPLALILKVAREVAEGLGAAHAKGLIHRDIKPGNIWLDGDLSASDPGQQVRRCKILDFGLARSVGTEEHQLTKSGVILGTPAFMAPEQALGEAIDHRIDLFALGVVLFRMATGKMPFAGDTPVAVMISLTTDTAPPVWTLNPNLPPALGDLIDKLLSREPAARPQTAAEVVTTLKRIVREWAARPVGAQNRSGTVGKPPPRVSTPTPVPPPRPVPVPPPPASPPTTNPEWELATEAELAPAPKPKPAPKPAPKPRVVAEPASAQALEAIPEPAAASGARKKLRPGRAKRKARPAALRRAAIWGTAAVALLVAAVAGYRALTATGTAELSTADSLTDARLRAGRVVLVSADGKEQFALTATERSLKVPAGRYVVRAEGADGLLVDPAELVLRRGETAVVRVALAPAARRPEPPKPTPPPKDADPDPAADRRGAEYVLASGGSVRVEPEGAAVVEVRDAADLPAGPFRLTEFRLGRAATATDAGFAALAGCRHVRAIDMQGAQVGTAALAHLKPLTTVRFLAIAPNFDDDGIALFDGCSELTTFWAGGTRVTDAGIAKLKAHPKLADVRVSDTALTDAGLKHLSACKGLTFLFVPNTRVTREGVEALARALPRCKIVWDGGTVEPTEPPER